MILGSEMIFAANYQFFFVRMVNIVHPLSMYEFLVGNNGFLWVTFCVRRAIETRSFAYFCLLGSSLL